MGAFCRLLSANIEDRQNIRVSEGGRGTRLLLEAGEPIEVRVSRAR
jgi:hypothetical protein